MGKRIVSQPPGSMGVSVAKEPVISSGIVLPYVPPIPATVHCLAARPSSGTMRAMVLGGDGPETKLETMDHAEAKLSKEVVMRNSGALADTLNFQRAKRCKY